MPFQSINQLPRNVRDSLPSHGQQSYMKSFNRAYTAYPDSEEDDNEEKRESSSHEAAWAAIRKKFKKDDKGKWHDI